MKVVIVGAGASGTFAAIHIKRLDPQIEVDLFEKSDKIGKKLSITGNGRCNITNRSISTANYYNNNFVEYAIREFDYKKAKKEFEKLGIYLCGDEKIYPVSYEAKSVVKTLEDHLYKSGVNVVLRSEVEQIRRQSDGFWVQGRRYDKLVLANGSSAYPALGGGSSGIMIAKSFGHSYKEFAPSLVGLTSNFEYKKELLGVKKECDIALFLDNQKVGKLRSDLLFTAYGLSGFGVLDLSYFVGLSLGKKRAHLEIDLISKAIDLDSFVGIRSNLSAVNLLGNFVGEKLARVVLKILQIAPETTLNKRDLKRVYFALAKFTIDISGTNGFEHSEVAIGGVSCCEVDNKTFMSKIASDLFIVGELLDVVGMRGGYNLHFAFASGYLAAMAIACR